MNYDEFDLMTAGTAAAFRDPEIGTAIALTPGGIRVCLVQWSSIARQAVVLPWSLLRDPDEAARLGDRIADMPRFIDGGGTMIHAGLTFAASQFDFGPKGARRRVIDLSGNGRDDDEAALAEARAAITDAGITINGLAVLEDRKDLVEYYRARVIGGPGAFAIRAVSFEDYAIAMRLKLLREISGPRLT